jgi:hypothetical protein
MMRIRIRRTISEIIELMESEHSTGMSINHIGKAGQNPFPPFALISERREVGGGGSTQSKHSRAHHKGGN